jgi:predicted TIM-barrel fold metal-dependent hydrolase
VKVLDTEQTPLDFTLPAGSCDTHVHLFGPQTEYPLVANRIYTPPPVGLDDLAALHTALGLDRAVVVQASVQGTNNSLLLKALSTWPSRLRGVAVVPDDTSDRELSAMRLAGVRGIRLNFESHGGVEPSLAKKRLAGLAKKISPHGFHIQMYISADLLSGLVDQVATLPCPVVLDHFGGPDVSKGADDPLFRELIASVKGGNIYVKLSALHRLSKQAGYEDLKSFVEAFVTSNPDRMLWGSDWPHALADRERTGPDTLRAEDDGANLNQLARWIPDRAVFHKILVDNPVRLYGF